MVAFENADFTTRRVSVDCGNGDPGRTFPAVCNFCFTVMHLLTHINVQLQYEFEYVPIISSPFQAFLHIPTRYDGATFAFDNCDIHPCPIFHFEASHIALMVEALAHFGVINRFRNPRVDLAAFQVQHLMELYKRHPSRVSDTSIVVPVDYSAVAASYSNSNLFPISHSLPLIPGSPPSPDESVVNYNPDETSSLTGKRDAIFDTLDYARSGDDPQNQKRTTHQHPPADIPALIPSSSMSTITSDVESSPVCNEPQAHDAELEAYSKEPGVTWQDIKYRPRLTSGDVNSIWRFSTAEDIIRGEY